MIRTEYERDALENLRSKYEKDGYEFFAELPLSALPHHVEKYIPDAIARKDDEFVAIEVKGRRIPSIQKQLERLKRQVESDPRWRMDIYFSDQISLESGPGRQTKERVNSAIQEAEDLLASGKTRSAFLLCWAIFEAIARTRFSAEFMRPQTPGRIITVLAENGTIEPSMADYLRDASRKRNALIHGELSLDIDQSDIVRLLSVLRELAQGIPA